MEPAQVRVVAFTDRVGDAANNLVLSKARALSLAAMLERIGLPRDMVEVIGKGEEDAPGADRRRRRRTAQSMRRYLRGRGQLLRVKPDRPAKATLPSPGTPPGCER